MANFKIVISDPKSKKAYQKEVDQTQSGFVGKKIGEKISGNFVGLTGYTLEIRGGSDSEGFPMRTDVEGTARKKILIALPPGFHPKIKGVRKRKSIRGNTISTGISQINVKVVEKGPKSIEELLGVKAEKKEEKKKEETPSEKPAEKKEEKPVEKPAEKKEEVKPTSTEEKKPETQEKAESKMGVKSLEEVEEKAEKKEEKK